MNVKHITMMVSVVGGLLFLAGSGCSDNDAAQRQAAMLRARLDAKEKEMACKIAALSTSCKDGDTTCNDNRAKALAECDRIAAEAEKALNSGATITTVTNTDTGTSTSSSTSTQ